jgi:hypothetical protein
LDKQVTSKIRKKKYEKFSDASAAIQKKKGISEDRANAYVALEKENIRR